MKKSVSHIFGGEAKVKVMRLFIFNPNDSFSQADVAKRAKIKSPTAGKVLRNLHKAGLIKKRGKLYSLDAKYIYLPALEHFLIDAAPMTHKELVGKLAKTGSVKLALISGVFLHDRDARVDLLVVGDNLREASLETAISNIEAELGREIRYAAFETPDFQYRLGIYDKLIRDILDHPHQKIVNKLGF